jgi:single-stranded-DNA-specific exonuclease
VTLAAAAPGALAGAVLGVERSATGRRWQGLDLEQERAAEAIAQTGVALPLARHLARRGVEADAAAAFLAPTLREMLPDPHTLRDAQPAAARLVAAARRGERIAVFADYDVDGGASAALLLWWLRGLDRRATLYVPDRIDEGYGPNAPAIAALAERHDLIVCVDCGTLSHEALAAAGGTDVVVLDHHLGGETLPPALAVVNPNRQDEDGRLAHLCAAAVVFLVLVEANRQMRAAGERGPDLMAMLDLVALATVADVAPLAGVNRALVRQGLSVMARRARPGLRALADAARMDGFPTAYHLGFLLGPRVNAGGRIGAADLGARLLATDDEAEAEALALRLDALNRERRDIEARVREAAQAQAEARLGGEEAPLAWAAGAGWHPGVVGIVASRLKEALGRPAVVIGLEGGEGKGSGRSVAGVDLGASVQRLAAEGWLVKGGGHRMAAGLTVEEARLEGAMERLGALLARQGAGAGGAHALGVDAVLMPGAATADLARALEEAGPFGQGAPAPLFALPELRVRHARPVGEGHLKLTLAQGADRIEAIAFRAEASGVAEAVRRAAGAPFHVAGRLELNRWRGRETVQLRVSDVAEADGG